MPRIKNITGPGVTTKVRMESADLGIVRWDETRKAYAVMFGDNFSEWRLRGDWQSPSILMYDEQANLLGIPWDDGTILPEGNRKQLWTYPHANPDYSTILPCDFIKIRDEWVVAAMVTQGLGNEKRTVFWRADDIGDEWQKTDPYLVFNHPGHPGNVMLTFEQLDDYVYIMGTGGLRRDRGIWLWRCPASTFPHGEWQPWGFNSVGGGWNWGVPNERTPILQGAYGELCLRRIQGNWVLSFFDAGGYRQTALTVKNITDNWTTANRVDYAHGNSFPQLYGGYIWPSSKLNERDGMRFLVSQWNTGNNDPYWVVEFRDTLQAQGPLSEDPKPAPPAPKPEPVPVVTPPPAPQPEEPEPVATTTDELFKQLVQELSASGAVEIKDQAGNKLTLREAVADTYVTAQVTRRIVAELAERFGIDVEAIYKEVRGA
ncbi:hypothetical protein MYRNA_244 [Mycobacterium phage Myrna]|uniref:DUF4185 domain-containing protein n=1 Tax=Mycobacterium phage Myrna TaxID=546805 RepID=B5LJL4_9CAUD|nr:gp244 [Mycobacterium phage Myrna]ACH62211.1 hypothetical protein MYRNA_244 [Mycobacterium phage Myrna]